VEAPHELQTDSGVYRAQRRPCDVAVSKCRIATPQPGIQSPIPAATRRQESVACPA